MTSSIQRRTVLALTAMAATTLGAVVIALPANAATCKEKDPYGNTNYYDCGPNDPNYGTATGKPSSSPTPTATTSPAPSPTATPTDAASPSPSATAAPLSPATITSVSASVINQGGAVNVRVRGNAAKTMDLYAILSPATTYSLIRTATVGSDGGVSFVNLSPKTNTTFQARERGNTQFSGTPVVKVRYGVAFAAITRTRARHFTFTGQFTPVHTAGLHVSLYRRGRDGDHYLGAATADAHGRWHMSSVFASTGTFTFFVRTAADAVNAAGSTPLKSVRIR
jgi:hypothetical protein